MIRFDNTLYVREHEKRPYGFGKRAFIVRINTDKLTALNCPFEHYMYNNHAHSLVWASGVMNLKEAKKELADWLTQNGFTKELVFVAD